MMFENMSDAMRHQQDMAEQHRHEIRTFMLELSDHQLHVFYHLLQGLSDPDGGPSMASYFQGHVAAIRDLKHGVCGGCGSNPCKTDTALEKLQEEGAPQGADEVVATEFASELVDQVLGPLCQGEVGALSPKQIEAMKEWNLDDLREEGTNKLLGFICIDCKFSTYPSIEDRMITPKGIDGCSGCREKGRFG